MRDGCRFSGVVRMLAVVFVFVLGLVMLTLIRCAFIDCIELPLYDFELRLLLVLLLLLLLLWLLLLFLLPFLFVLLFVLLPLDATDGVGDTDFLLLAWVDDLLFENLFFISFWMM